MMAAVKKRYKEILSLIKRMEKEASEKNLRLE